jgi:hypothetical protein
MKPGRLEQAESAGLGRALTRAESGQPYPDDMCYPKSLLLETPGSVILNPGYTSEFLKIKSQMSGPHARFFDLFKSGVKPGLQYF